MGNPNQRSATMLDLREVRRDLTMAVVRAMNGLTNEEWPGDLFDSLNPVLPDMTVDPDILGLLVFMPATDLRGELAEIESNVIPCIPAQLSGVTGWIVLTFNPNLTYDEAGIGERLTWSVRYSKWIHLDGIEDAPAVRDPFGLVWGWNVVELDNLH